jgi:RHS repeat-associated protein
VTTTRWVVDTVTRHAWRRGVHRRDRPRTPTTIGVIVAVLLSYAVVTAAGAPEASAVEPPPGEVVDSVPNFGWTQGDFSVSNDGAAQYSLPLWVPQGRGRSTPKLALSYHSRAGNGLLGVGWSLSGLSAIGWCPRTHAQDGYSNAGRFNAADALCLDGNRLVPQGTGSPPERLYKTERETFARIIGYGAEDGIPDYFRVWAKDGMILTFGQTNDARLAGWRLKAKPDPDDPDRPDFANPGLVVESNTRITTAWAVNRMEDRNGNAATVEYRWPFGEPNHTDMSPSVIRYAPNREVRFAYRDQGRPDPIETYAGGIRTRVAHRLERIEMWGGPLDEDPVKLREYRPGYQTSLGTKRSLLTEIKECDGEGACKLPLALTYSQGSDTFQRMPETTLAEEQSNFLFWVKTGDVNGDGRGDLFYHNRESDRMWIQLGTGTGTGFAAPVESPGVGDVSPLGLRPVVVDADSRTDLMVDTEFGDDRHRWQLFEFDGSRFVKGPGGDVGVPYADEDDIHEPAYLGDLDGNGLPDFIPVLTDLQSGGTFWGYRLNTGGAGENRFGTFGVTLEPDVEDQDRGVQVVDTDGEGRAEVLQQRWLPDEVPGGYTVWGLDAVGNVEAGLANVANSRRGYPHDHLPMGALFGDLNGDGLDDAVVVERTFPETNTTRWRLQAQLNSGRGFGSPVQPNPPTWTYGVPGEEGGGGMGSIVVADFNGDGRDDVLMQPFEDVCQSRAELYEWNGERFVPSWVVNNTECGSHPVDIDADGILDLVVDGDADRRIQVIRHMGGVPDRLTRIGNGNGQRVEIDYSTLADRDVHTPCGAVAYPSRCLTKGQSIVKQHRVDNLTGSAQSWDIYEHDYQHARADMQGRGWLGFAQHTVTRTLTGAVTRTEFDNTTRDTTHKAYPLANLPKTITSTVTDAPGGREFRRITVNNHFPVRLDGGSYTVELRNVIETEQERPAGGAWQEVRSRATVSDYDQFGNVDETVSTTAGGRTVTEDLTFRNDTANWLIGLPTRQSTTGCDAANRCTTRTTRLDYWPNGDLRLTEVEPDQAALRLLTESFYDQFGNVTSVRRTASTGPARTETFEYADGLHPTAVVNAALHRTVIQTDAGLGLPLRVTDPNGVVVTMRYDSFGRPREINRADGSFEHITHDLPSPGTQRVTTTVSGGGVSTVVVDRLGRQIEQAVKAFDGRMATSTTEYDPMGRAVRVSRPAFAGEARQVTTTAYDNRDRVRSVTASDAAVISSTYNGLETHIRDAKGVQSYTVQNKDGDIASSFEDDPNATAWLETKFEYDGFGQPTKITAPDQTVQSMRYDILGRRFELIDPSSGKTTTGYNAFGDVTSETDGTNRTTTFVPDALGRVATTTSADGTATNTWDTAEFGKGKLTSARSADGVTTAYTYNDLSQIQTTRWTIDGTTYQFDHTYNLGRPDTLTYPAIPGTNNAGRLTVANVYNAHGYLSQIKDAAAGGPVYWQVPPDGRNAAGQLTREAFGNGVTTTRAYQPATGLPTGITTTGPGTVGQLVNLSVGYDLNRNVTSRQETVRGAREVYTHDTLDRLATWRLEHAGTQTANTTTYTYDKIGNLKTEAVAGTPDRPDITYTHSEGAPRHALTGRNSDRYTYDAAGRQLTGPRRTVVAYNRAGLPKILDWGQNLEKRTTFAYGPDGTRALKRDRDAGGQTVVYAGGLFERRLLAGTGSTEIHNLHNIVVEGRVVAQVNRVQAATGGPITRTAPNYLHADQQGSTLTVTNAGGRPIGSGDDFLGALSYDPFGARTTPTGEPLGPQRHGGPRQGYTGHYHDDEYQLIDAKGRWYDPNARRFITPDPVLADPLSSQSLNRYAYVQNNPVTLTDPTGLCPTCEVGGAGSLVDDAMAGLTDAFSFFLGTDRQLSQTPANGVANTADSYDGDSGHSDTPERPSTSAGQDAPGAFQWYSGWLAETYILPALPPSLLGAYDKRAYLADSFAFDPNGVSPQYMADRLAARWSYARTHVDWHLRNVTRIVEGIVGALGPVHGIMAADALLAKGMGGEALRFGGSSSRIVNRSGSRKNCANCVIAGDATLSGAPASALPGGITPRSVLERHFGGRFQWVRGGRSGIERMLSAAGPGARGIVFGEKMRDPGHYFNAVVNQRGAPRFIDFQIDGKSPSWSGYRWFYFLWTHKP